MVTKKTILPKLRKIDSSLKKHKYKLKFTKKQRRLAIDDGIKYQNLPCEQIILINQNQRRQSLVRVYELYYLI